MCVFSVPAGDSSSTQTFALTSTVTYVFDAANKYKRYEPPAPPVLFKVPYDVFYPVLPAQNSAPRTSLTLGLSLLFVGVTTLLVGVLSL